FLGHWDFFYSLVGRVDRDALWRFDVRAARAERLPLHSGARWVSLHSSSFARFSVDHRFDGARFEVTVHNFSDPTRVLARAAVKENENEFVGDASVWGEVPLLYVEHLNFAPWNDFVLIKVVPSSGRVEVQRLHWYDDTYDKDYQGVVDVLELGGGDFALISVQRSSRLIVHDLTTGMKRDSIDLADRGGNPKLQTRDAGKEIWASDYDTLVVIRREDLRIVRTARLQRADAGTQQFIGDFSFAPDEDICAVARPFSGDIVGIDVATLKVKRSARLGRQPLELVALPHGEVAARDWKSGDLLQGKLKRRWFAG
ncbi:MAG: hypothetical protein ACREQA_02830, partial [Candidatus Binatia bacterium]